MQNSSCNNLLSRISRRRRPTCMAKGCENRETRRVDIEYPGKWGRVAVGEAQTEGRPEMEEVATGGAQTVGGPEMEERMAVTMAVIQMAAGPAASRVVKERRVGTARCQWPYSPRYTRPLWKRVVLRHTSNHF